jgi:glycosyltransferase involved in cell wall biosynthesis
LTATSPLSSGHRPKVSIVMAAYNAEKTLAVAVNSVAGQSFTDWELIVVNNRSTDDTERILQSHARSDDRIVSANCDTPGAAAARNAGLDLARGDYIAFLDADDLYYENALGDRVAYLDRYTKRQAVFCQAELTDQDLNPLKWILGTKPIVTFKDMHGCPVHINSFMARAWVIGDIRFDEAFPTVEDWLFLQQISRTGIKFYQVPTCKVAYRQLKTSSVLSNFSHHANMCSKVLDIAYGTDPHCPNPHPAYRSGLRKPPKLSVLLRRRLQVMIKALLDGQEEAARLVAEEYDAREWGRLSVREVYNIVKFVLVRHYVCPTDAWQPYWRQNSVSIKSFFEKNFAGCKNFRKAGGKLDSWTPLGKNIDNYPLGLRRLAYLPWRLKQRLTR